MLKSNNASQAVVQYADLADIVKMLNMQGGGSLMDVVNDAQTLVDLPRVSGPHTECPTVEDISLGKTERGGLE
jgi:hypothetical protein